MATSILACRITFWAVFHRDLFCVLRRGRLAYQSFFNESCHMRPARLPTPGRFNLLCPKFSSFASWTLRSQKFVGMLPACSVVCVWFWKATLDITTAQTSIRSLTTYSQGPPVLQQIEMLSAFQLVFHSKVRPLTRGLQCQPPRRFQTSVRKASYICPTMVCVQLDSYISTWVSMMSKSLMSTYVPIHLTWYP